MTTTLRVGIVFVALAAGACFPKTGPVPPALSAPDAAAAAAKWPGTTPESLNAGRDVFVAHCNQCHGYPDMTAESEADWPGTVHTMGGKAKLSAKETDDVLHFILASRPK